MHPRSPSLVAGLRIGDYVLVRRIGRGGMAEVWCAKRVSERRTSNFVAIKVVADQYVGDPRFQRMFRAEAEISSLLSHANIVRVFDEGEDGGRSYLVMEWVDGVNLLKVGAALTFIEDEPWKHELIAYIVGQLLYALGYAHSITLHDGNPLGIVHRDVSPQNVLVSNQGEVKLTDFGVAHHVLDQSSGIHIKGKVRYMAPEQLNGHTRDPRVDLYAVGAILHELLDGRRFRHHVEDQREMYIEVLAGKVPRLSRPVPPELDALRLALLEPDPKARVPTADDALALLERFPGYGDARRDLTRLCAGLTGVVRPRVGPGTSQGLPAASNATAAPPPTSEAVATPAPSATAGPAQPASAPEPSSESERHRSRTLRILPAVPGTPEPIRNDTSPLPLATSHPRTAGSVHGEVRDVAGGSGALVGAGPHDIPPDTAVMTPSMIGRIAGSGPIGVEEQTDSQRERSTITSRRSATRVPSPNPATQAPRRRPWGTLAAVLVSLLALGSLGMGAAFFMKGDFPWSALVDPNEGRADREVASPPDPERVAFEAVDDGRAASRADVADERTSDGGSASAADAPASAADAPTSAAGTPASAAGTPASAADAPTSAAVTPTSAAVTPPPVGPAEDAPPAKRQPSERKPPTVYSGLIVAVDGTEPLLVRVGSGKPVTIESRKSHAFRVPVGKGRKVQWKRKTDAAWTETRVDIRSKCELQVRVPSRKTMVLGTCG